VVPWKYRHSGVWPSDNKKYVYRLDTSEHTGVGIDCYDHNIRAFGMAVKSKGDAFYWSWPFGATVTDSIVYGCVLWATAGRCVDFGQPANSTVYVVNNIMHNSLFGIYCGTGGCMTYVFYNNTMYEYSSYAVYVATTTYTCHLHNNLGWKAVPGVNGTFRCASTDASHNAYVSTWGEGSNSLDISSYSPGQIFAKPNQYNFHLVHDSPCYAKGKSLINDDDGLFNVLEDIDGDRRRFFSIGADEGAFIPLIGTPNPILINSKSNSSVIKVRRR
jgi:hypothetical protein